MTSPPPPFELSRRVRLCLNPASPLDEALRSPRHNTFAGWPTMVGLGVFYEVEVRCEGQPDSMTGYLLNISAVDEAVRGIGLPLIHRSFATGCGAMAALRELVRLLADELGGVLASVRWRLTPYYSISMSASMTDRVTITQQFEFAAAHRLHCDSMSPEENRKTFGRCNNPNSHGHNYRLEVAVESPLNDSGAVLDIAALEQIVDAEVIRRLDHTNLNIDVPEFAAINPSVENIARVCHTLIREPIARAGGRLERVTVWETEKTSCTYRG